MSNDSTLPMVLLWIW